MTDNSFSDRTCTYGSKEHDGSSHNQVKNIWWIPMLTPSVEWWDKYCICILMLDNQFWYLHGSREPKMKVIVITMSKTCLTYEIFQGIHTYLNI